MAVLRLKTPWIDDGIRLNLIEIATQGLGWAGVGLLAAAIRNWAGRSK
jgi:hypothetical protein